ncbi:MAG: helix-turn-helix domain-containing protein [Acidobacteria bacterium]|nr:helix-turn-helix domain-containing protein [Acidobacteriota bacterium]
MPSNKKAKTRKPGEVFNPYRLFEGVWVPTGVLPLKEICPAAKLLYGQLGRYAGKDGQCFPSQATLAKDLGISDRQVRNLLGDLEREGFIRTVQQGLRRNNRYVFLWHPALESCLRSLERNSAAGPKRKNTSGQDRKSSAHKEKEGKEKKQKETPRSVSAKRVRAQSASDGLTSPSEEVLSAFRENLELKELFKASVELIWEELFKCFGVKLGRPDRVICERILSAGRGLKAENICSMIRRYATSVSAGKKPAPRKYGFFVTHVSSYSDGHPPGGKFRWKPIEQRRDFRPESYTEEGIAF